MYFIIYCSLLIIGRKLAFVISLNQLPQKTHLYLLWYYNCEQYYVMQLHAFTIEENTLVRRLRHKGMENLAIK